MVRVLPVHVDLPMIEPLQKDDALLADIAGARGDRDRLHLWWLGQSGFLIQWQEKQLLLDPYLSDSLTHKYAATDKPHVRMTALPLAPGRLNMVDVVTSSHNHTDHFDPDTLRPLLQANPALRIVIPEANRVVSTERLGIPSSTFLGMDDGISLNAAGFEIHGIAAAHETMERDDRGHCKFLGYIIRTALWTIYHSGDTILYDRMVDRLRKFSIDLALLPINGRSPERRVAGNLWGREAAHLAHKIRAGLVIPMHYEMFEFNTTSPNEFIDECNRLRQPHCVLRCGERYCLNSTAPSPAAH